MGKQTIRQRARQQALDVAARHRRERAAREKRLQDLAASAIAAALERDEFVASADQRIGAALRQMTEVEGLTLREAVEWCGEAVAEREAMRLRQLAADADEAVAEPDGTGAAAMTSPSETVA
jgi:hypothetical protein